MVVLIGSKQFLLLIFDLENYTIFPNLEMLFWAVKIKSRSFVSNRSSKQKVVLVWRTPPSCVTSVSSSVRNPMISFHRWHCDSFPVFHASPHLSINYSFTPLIFKPHFNSASSSGSSLFAVSWVDHLFLMVLSLCLLWCASVSIEYGVPYFSYHTNMTLRYSPRRLRRFKVGIVHWSFSDFPIW